VVISHFHINHFIFEVSEVGRFDSVAAFNPKCLAKKISPAIVCADEELAAAGYRRGAVLNERQCGSATRRTVARSVTVHPDHLS